MSPLTIPALRPSARTGQLVTPSWLSTLGIEPLLGRVFTDAESQPYAPDRVIVLSHAFWQRRFGADPAILNQQIRVQGVARTIIGVMPADFRYQATRRRLLDAALRRARNLIPAHGCSACERA